MTTVRIALLDDLVEGGATRFDVDGHRLCVVRIGDSVYAIGDRCTHADVSLSGGEVDEDAMTVECPKHGSEFSLESGDAITLPATKPVPTYDVNVVDGEVEVTISEVGSEVDA
ncbi:MAG TPA: non-heme iron oxygenase ferredoxin subunit [Microthrixaceae bacterium]|nr:non-heme iron oxygenase ferredoxin subunit [Microthrixaceae bacterium]